MADATDNAIPIILASGSPRRRELAERIGWAPQVFVSDIPEEPGAWEAPKAYAARLAEQKARDVAEQLRGDAERPRWLLAADTIVEADGAILEKPADAAEARAMLTEMSGGWHTVITSFCWYDRSRREPTVRTIGTDVQFRELPAAMVDRYVATGEPLDKAGAYGIQDYGSMLVRRLEGSYFNVVGLPICEVVETLESLGAWAVHPMMDGPAETSE